MKYFIYHREREYAREVGDPQLAQVEASSPKEAESKTAHLGLTGTLAVPVTPAAALGNVSAPARNNGRAPHPSVYELITQRIIGLLEAGTIPWKKPWKVSTAWPRNLVTKRPYRGINVFVLLAMSYESPFWLTFRQATELGGYIRKGEKACPVVFWKQTIIEDKETKEKHQVPLLRFYHVFNASQCENLKNAPPLAEQLGTLVKPADVVARMPQPPAIKHGMTKAFYSPTEDFIGLPSLEKFANPEAYFSTLYHEAVHASGHPARLNRPSLSAQAGFGSDPYCREELVAELGAAFLCAHADIAERTVENSAAYIKNWLGRLKSDKRLVVQAAAQAQVAADYILGIKPDTPSAGESAPETAPKPDMEGSQPA